MKILVVDDHVLIREALRGVLKELKDDVPSWRHPTAVRPCGSSSEHADLDLILLDLNLPDRDGFSMLAELRERYPAISVVVLSALARPRQGRHGLSTSARSASFRRSAQREVMLSALQLVFSGGIYIPTEILGRASASSRRPDAARPAADRVDSPADLGLTERQVEVLALMMQGKSNKAICRVLDLAEPTVKNHVTAILKALKVTNRTEAVIAVGELGWELPPTAQIVSRHCRLSAAAGSRSSSRAGSTWRAAHRAHRLVQQMVTARRALRAVVGGRVAADQKGRDRRPNASRSCSIASMPIFRPTR